MKNRKTAGIVLAIGALIAVACGADTDAIVGERAELVLDDRIADNGYAKVTLGMTFDLTEEGLASINGNHEVGDPEAEVVDTYQARIAAGEHLAITCSDGAIVARARAAYRLVFFTTDEVVTRISSLGSEFVVPR